MAMAGNDTLTPDNIMLISYVYIAFLIPSVIGSFSVLVVSLLRWRNLQEQRLLLVQLALADLLASAVLLLVTSFNVHSPTKYSSELCLYGLPLALVFYVLSFMLVISYAIKSRNVIQGWRTRPADCEDVQSGKTKEKVLYALLWSLPIGLYLLYASYLATRQIQTVSVKCDVCESCILFLHIPKDNCAYHNSEPQVVIYYVLVSIVVAVLLSCIVIYKKVFKWQQGQQQQQEGLFPVEGDGQSNKRFKRVKHTVLKMMMVILVCWTPALLLLMLVWKIDHSKLFPLYIIQASTVSLQGLLNSLVYAWKRPNFTEAVLGERTPLITYDRVSFFEESLKTQLV